MLAGELRKARDVLRVGCMSASVARLNLKFSICVQWLAQLDANYCTRTNNRGKPMFSTFIDRSVGSRANSVVYEWADPCVVTLPLVRWLARVLVCSCARVRVCSALTHGRSIIERTRTQVGHNLTFEHLNIVGHFRFLSFTRQNDNC